MTTNLGGTIGSWSRLVPVLLACAAVNAAEAHQVPRHPQGIYAIVGTNEAK